MVRILLVEDEFDICELISLHLSNEGYEVLSTDNGISAIELFGKREFSMRR